MPNRHLQGWITLSIVAALATIGLKATAYGITASVGLLSDALESGVNLVAALAAMLSLRIAARPADSTHAYGHEKIEYFSSGLEGGLVTAAGLGIIGIAANRFVHPVPLESIDLGCIIGAVASVINLVVGVLLVRVGKRSESIVLEADGRHLLTDVWTTWGVIAGLVAVRLTGYSILDPLIAVAVAVYIIGTGVRLIRRSFDGLMDRALPTEEVEAIRRIVRESIPVSATFHAVRTRRAGVRRFADFHLLVPGVTSVRAGHDLSLEVERKLAEAFPNLQITIHIEPIEDAASFQDNTLEGVEPADLR